MQDSFPFALKVAPCFLFGVCCVVQLKAIYGRFVLGLAHWGTEFGVHRKEHMRKGGAKEGAINMLVPRCPWSKDIVTPWAEELDSKITWLVGQPDREALL